MIQRVSSVPDDDCMVIHLREHALGEAVDALWDASVCTTCEATTTKLVQSNEQSTLRRHRQ